MRIINYKYSGEILDEIVDRFNVHLPESYLTEFCEEQNILVVYPSNKEKYIIIADHSSLRTIPAKSIVKSLVKDVINFKTLTDDKFIEQLIYWENAAGETLQLL